MGILDDQYLTLEGDGGFKAVFSPLGAKLLALYVPTSDGGAVQVAMASAGHPDDPGADSYAGAVCGRVANRIAGAAFTLEGVAYKLAANEGSKQLHGGPGGFSHRLWTAERKDGTIRFALHSPDGDQGYPGTADVVAVYGFDGATLWLDMTAIADRTTVVNLTNHVYLNLAGGGSALGHQLEIPASRMTPVSDDLIPTGALDDVAGTRFDFRRFRTISGSYDHNFCLDAGRGASHLAARLVEPLTGRTMELETTEPAVQLYTGDHFSEGTIAPFSKVARNGGIALEPQTYPDAVNRPQFPSAVLKAGETYHHRIAWRFSGF